MHATHTPPSTRLGSTNLVGKEKAQTIVGDDDWKPATDDLSHSRSAALITLYTSRWGGRLPLEAAHPQLFIARPSYISDPDLMLIFYNNLFRCDRGLCSFSVQRRLWLPLIWNNWSKTYSLKASPSQALAAHACKYCHQVGIASIKGSTAAFCWSCHNFRTG